MEKREKDVLYYEKLRTIFLGAILAVLLALLIGALAVTMSFRRYTSQIRTIVDRMETVSAQLEELDVEKLVRTTNELSDVLDAAKIDDIVTSLHDVSNELSEVEWKELATNVNELAEAAQESINDVKVSLDKVKELDFETLNQSIRDLSKVIEPLANFAKRLG